MYWGAAKRYMYDNCDYSFKELEKIVPKALNSFSLDNWDFACITWRFINAYRKGLMGIDILKNITNS